MCASLARAGLSTVTFAFAIGVALVSGSPGCARGPACDGLACAAACPREAAVDASGRCACADGDVAVLGACVPLRAADAYCGPGERMDPASATCVFRACDAGAALDVASGACTPRGLLPHGGAIACAAGSTSIVEAGRTVCAAPAAGCPRGTAPEGRACRSAPACPPGAIAEGLSASGGACRPVVTAGGRAGRRVDLGAWAALAIGVDGGVGAAALCQPLAQRPSAFGVHEAATATDAAEGDASAPQGPAVGLSNGQISVAVAVMVPNQDVSRVHSEVRARDATGRELDAAAEALVSDTVSSLVEMLRGLGGEASSAAVELEVRCDVER